MRWATVLHALRALGIVISLSLCVGPAAAYEEEQEPPDPTRQPQAAEVMPLASQSTLLSIARSAAGLIAVGDRGHILHSQDGRQWTQRASPLRRMLTRVRFPEASHGWVTGYDAAILESTDAGSSWVVRNFDPENWPLFDLHFSNEGYGVAVGARGLMLNSENHGNNWSLVENEITDLLFTLNRLVKLNDGTLMAIGERGMLLRSADDGRNWDMLQQPYVGTWFDGIPLGEKGVLLMGLRGHVYEAANVTALGTEDPLTWDEYAAASVENPQQLADMGWIRHETGTQLTLYTGTMLTDGEVLIAGTNGLLLRSEQQRRVFRQHFSPRGLTIADLLIESDRILGVGRSGVSRIPLDHVMVGEAVAR